MTLERRSFLSRLAALTGLAAAGAPDIAGATPLPSSEWDMSWLGRLTGKHKQVFDVSDMERGPGVVKNWLDAHETVYGLKGKDLSAVIGIAGRAFPINASDALYQKYPIGELWKVNDPETGKPAMHNPFMDGGKAPPTLGVGVRPLQARGVIFWQCNNALHNSAIRIADAIKKPEPEIYADLRASLNPGVIVVPAHTMLLGLCQDRGCAYEFI